MQSFSDQVGLLFLTEPGDILFAHMPLANWEVDAVPEGHRCRPYVVLSKTGYGLWALPCTSQVPKQEYCDFYHSLPREKHPTYSQKDIEKDAQKGSFVHLDELVFLPVENLIEKMGQLKHGDKQAIQRKLFWIKNKHPEIMLMEGVIPVTMGDVIQAEERYYYIFQSKKDEVYGYEIIADSLESTMDLGFSIPNGNRYLDIALPKRFSVDAWKTAQLIRMTRGKQAQEQEVKIREFQRIREIKRQEEKRRKRTPYFVLPIGTTFYQKKHDDAQYYFFTLNDTAYGLYSEDLSIIKRDHRARVKIKKIYMEDYSEMREPLPIEVVQLLVKRNIHFPKALNEAYYPLLRALDQQKKQRNDDDDQDRTGTCLRIKRLRFR